MVGLSGAWPGGSSGQAWDAPQVSWGFTGSLVRTGWEWEQLVAVGWGASSHAPPASVLMERGLPGLSWPLLVLVVLAWHQQLPSAPTRPDTASPGMGLPELAWPGRDVWGLTGPPGQGGQAAVSGGGCASLDGLSCLLSRPLPTRQPLGYRWC